MEFYHLCLERDQDIIDDDIIHATLLKQKAEEPDFDLNVYLSEWAALNSNLAKLNFVYEELEKHSLPIFTKDKKCDATAILYRKKGNTFFGRGQYARALDLYTTSVHKSASAKIMGLAYANRAVACLKSCLYHDCLSDIDKALKCGYQDKEKLQMRKEECSNNMKCQFKIYENSPEISRHSTIEGASNLVEITRDEKWGRHVVATKNIKIGNVIAVEKPMAYELSLKEQVYCSECLELCYSTIPCENCTQVQYCNPVCKDTAFNTHHKYECPILLSINNITEAKDKICLPLKMILTASAKDNKFDSSTLKGISRLQRLITGEDIDLFAKFSVVAGVALLVKHHTDFFNTVVCSETKFKENLLELFFVCELNCTAITEYTEKFRSIYCAMNPIAKGLYSFYSVFNHSCDSNVAQNFHGTTLVLRAVNTIRKGEQLFVNYGCSYLCEPMAFRKDFLLKNYSIKCKCEACANEWKTLSIDLFYGKINNYDYSVLRLIRSLREVPELDKLDEALKKVQIKRAVKKNEQNKNSVSYSLAKYALLCCYDVWGNKRCLSLRQ